MFCEIPMLHWEGCEVTLLVGTRVCIGWLRSILQSGEERVHTEFKAFIFCFFSLHVTPQRICFPRPK